MPGEAAQGAGTLGMEVIESRGKVFVFRVAEASPAAEARIVPGTEIMRIGDKSMEHLAADAALMPVPDNLQTFYFIRYVQNLLTGNPGSRQSLHVRGLPSSTSRHLELTFTRDTRPRSGTFANMPSTPFEKEVTTLRGGIRLIRFNFFLLDIMEDIRNEIVASRGAPGLILDLRGNPGGVGYMAAGMAGFLTDERIDLGKTQMRQGHFNFIGFPQKQSYTGPLAILIDGRSASTSEILAAGLQEAGRARIFGQPSAGAVLPSMFKDLPNGDILQSVIADFRTAQGRVLEGVGVQPDETIEIGQRALLLGRDPVLDAAVRWLESQDPEG
jgi:carboxyl-terminal processing protease